MLSVWCRAHAAMLDDGFGLSMQHMLSAQDDSGASRDEVAAALLEVADGKIPKDRIALRQLYREIKEWPFVEEGAPAAGEEAAAAAAAAASTSSPYEAITDTGMHACLARCVAC